MIDWEERKKQNDLNYAFRNKIKAWLDPDGKTGPIYAHNHPSPQLDKVHYTAGRMRICCEIDTYGQEFAFLHHEFYFENRAYALKSCRLEIGSDLSKEIDQMNRMIDMLPPNIGKLTLMQKLNMLKILMFANRT